MHEILQKKYLNTDNLETLPLEIIYYFPHKQQICKINLINTYYNIVNK